MTFVEFVTISIQFMENSYIGWDFMTYGGFLFVWLLARSQFCQRIEHFSTSILIEILMDTQVAKNRSLPLLAKYAEIYE